MNNSGITSISFNSYIIKSYIKKIVIILICFSFLAVSNYNLPLDKNQDNFFIDHDQEEDRKNEILDEQSLIETAQNNFDEISNSNSNVPDIEKIDQNALLNNNPLDTWNSLSDNSQNLYNYKDDQYFEKEEVITWGEVTNQLGIQELIDQVGKTKTASETETRLEEGNIEIVVGLKDGITFNENNYKSKLTTSTVKQTIEKLNSFIVKVPLSFLENFYLSWSLLDEVRYIEPNILYTVDYIPNDPDWSLQWGNQRISTDLAWDIQPGNFSEVLVAVIDTGIDYNHPDLSSQYVPLGFDWVNNDTDPMDDHYHGTHVAGIVAGTINNSIGIAGTANVSIMAEKFLNSGGSGTSEDGANAIIHAVDQGADILSNSWGGASYSTLIKDALAYAEANDAVIIAAAGNSASSSPFYPAAYPEAISVSATDISDNLASFSNYGETIEIAAPGVNIYSTMPSNSYGYLDGTSMATPYVSGVAALILSQFPDWTAQQVRLHLQETAEDLGAPGRDDLFGYGLVNAFDAVQPPPEHNLKVFLSAPNGLLPNTSSLINVTVFNAGLANESNVITELWINNSLVNTSVLGNMESGTYASSSYNWTAINEGSFNITAFVYPVTNESTILDNIAYKRVFVSSKIIGFVYTHGEISLSDLKTFYEGYGYIVDEITTELTEEAIEQYAFLFVGEGGSPWSINEVIAVENYIQNGGTFISIGDSSPADGAMQIASNNGITFTNTALGVSGVTTIFNVDHPLMENVASLYLSSVFNAVTVSGSAESLLWDSTNSGIYGATVDIGFGHFLVLADDFNAVLYYNDNDVMFANVLDWPNWQPPDHDLAVSLEVPLRQPIDETVRINTSVFNRGLKNESSVELQLWINGILEHNYTFPSITNGTIVTTYYNWTPSVIGDYNITAYVEPVFNESLISNNIKSVSVIVAELGNVAILQDANPWDSSSTFDILNSYGITYDLIPSTQFGLVDLSVYQKVIISSDQPQSFYNSINTYLEWLESYTEDGGILEIHGASNGWNGGSWINPLPGGFSYVSSISDNVDIIDDHHPILFFPNNITDGELDGWGSSIHGFLTNTSTANIILADGINPALIELAFGSGTIIVSTQTLEFGYSNSNSKLLENIILYFPASRDHDLSVSLKAPQSLLKNETIIINVTITNLGLNNETDVEFQLWINNTLVKNQTYALLLVGESEYLNYIWKPVIQGIYNITAYVRPVTNETYIFNNNKKITMLVGTPIIQYSLGDYIQLDSQGIFWANFTYVSNIDSTHVYVDMGNGLDWFSVNILNRKIEDGTIWIGYYWPGQIETNIGVNDTLDWLSEQAVVVGTAFYDWDGMILEAWNISILPAGFNVYHHKETGIWLDFRANGTTSEIYMVDTNMIVYQPPEHNLKVFLNTPTKVEPGTSSSIEISVSNAGLSNETNVLVDLWINNSLVNSTTFLEVINGSSVSYFYSFNPIVEGIYNITAYVHPVVNESSLLDNLAFKQIFVNDNTIAFIYTHGEYLLTDLKLFYEGLGFFVDEIYDVLTDENLINYNFIFVGEGGSAWTQSEITAMENYIQNGGIFVAIGDSSPADGAIQIGNNNGITFTNTAPGVSGVTTIFDVDHPLMENVASLYLSSVFNAVTVSGSAEPLLWDNTNSGIYGATVDIGSGHFLVLADDFYAVIYNEDNEIMFGNILNWQPHEHDISIELDYLEYILPNDTMLLNVTIFNKGLANESNLQVQLWINNSLVLNQTYPSLNSSNFATFNYSWNPSIEGAYNITAYVVPKVNETYITNNRKMITSFIRTPILQFKLGDYIQLDDMNGFFANFTYVSNIDTTHVYVDMGNGVDWFIVNTLNRRIENGSMWVGYYLPSQIETNIDINSSINWLTEQGIVVGTTFYNWNGMYLEAWIVDIQSVGVQAIYHKNTGIWLDYHAGGNDSIIWMVDTNMITWQPPDHDIEVSLEIPNRLPLNETALINSTVFNRGVNNETDVKFQLWINGNLEYNQSIPLLEYDSSFMFTYNWTPIYKGVFNLTAYVFPVINETYIANNRYIVFSNVYDPTAKFVAILDADGTEQPSYWTGGWANNYLGLYNGLINAGLNVIVVNNSAILAGILYEVSVLIMVDNAPSDSASIIIKDWYFEGGSLLTFDSSICFLTWAGVLPPESAGSNGYGIYWNYNSPSIGIVVDNTHPVLAGYSNGETIYGTSGDAQYFSSVMQGTSAGLFYEPLVKTAAGSDYDLIVAYEPSIGGYVVQIWDANHWQTTTNQLLIENAVNWLQTSEPTPHELSITLNSPPLVLYNETISINATVYNRGLNNETNIEIELWINNSLVKNQTLASLNVRDSFTFSYVWIPNTEGYYNITAYVVPVANETYFENNVDKGLSLVTHPILQFNLGDYILLNDTIGNWFNFTYISYIDSTHVYIEAFNGSNWFIVDILTRIIENGSMWIDMYWPVQIETNINLGKAINWLGEQGVVVGSSSFDWKGTIIETWVVDLQISNSSIFFHKTTGIWIDFQSSPGMSDYFLDDTNMIIESVPPLITSPSDITFEKGDLGYEISWTLTDSNPNIYFIYIDGEEVSSDFWTSGESIIVNLDSFPVGEHNFTILVIDKFGNSNTDSVIATITMMPQTTSTETTSSTSATSTATTSTSSSSDTSTSSTSTNQNLGVDLIIAGVSLIFMGSLGGLTAFLLRRRRNL